ncbi:hypothetical protein [Aurantibacillus circumpalustris]|uniref:hypothetical protein n=1 Tax=Aurantibacillus circumpalustris TaxID=3036359 RepID=UPI00295B4033|nr:hypothetical protein [Aurantibacillus circumpalustris]
MAFQDTLKYQDSVIAANKILIAAQNDSIGIKKALMDSIVKPSSIKTVITKDVSSFWDQLGDLMITKEIAVFSVGCIIMGAVIITADFIYYMVANGDDKKSLFSFKYENKKIFVIYLFWAGGSGIIAYVATSIGMFKCSIIACVTIAVTWPTILPKIIKKLNEGKDEKLNQTGT